MQLLPSDKGEILRFYHIEVIELKAGKKQSPAQKVTRKQLKYGLLVTFPFHSFFRNLLYYFAQDLFGIILLLFESQKRE